MAYTTINKSTDNFNTKLYTGTGSSNAVTGVGFQPDWTWIKNRDQTDDHKTFDAVRGVTKVLKTNTTGAESTDSNTLTAFGTDGFTVGTDGGVNGSGEDLVAWNWKANGAGSSNTDGNITSTVSANTTAGFSIVKYTGNNNNNQTVGHGLGVAPKMIIIKRLGTGVSGTANWVVYHKSIGASVHLHLNTTDAQATDNGMFNSTDPTSSVFTIHAGDDVNKNNDEFIAYCFAEKTGYSKFGSYTGNGSSDGPFVYTGFKPSFLIIKKSNGGGAWVMYDDKRSDVPNANPNDQVLYPAESSAELSSSTREIDTLSNGFKIKATGGNVNADADSFIYIAFGQSLVGSNNIPCTAR